MPLWADSNIGRAAESITRSDRVELGCASVPECTPSPRSALPTLRIPDASGSLYLDRITGQQQRLGIARTFLSPNVFNIFATEALSTCTPQEITPSKIETARNELLTLFARIDDGEFSIRDVASQSMLVERAQARPAALSAWRRMAARLLP